MIYKTHKKQTSKRGMTLSEVVIAIAIIAFSIPLILAATSGAHHTRLAAEADTRSAWLVRDVQHIIMRDGSEIMPHPGFEKSFSFPTDASPEVTMELSYKQDGTLLTEDVNQASYLVTVKAEPYLPQPNQSVASSLAMITINIQYPAKAPLNQRKRLTYQYISCRSGIL